MKEEKERFKFSKAERLHHKNLVEGLFGEGRAVYEFPLRMVWRTLSPDRLEKSFRGEKPKDIGKLQMMVTIPKKKRRHAVDRVLLRRRIREAYRQNRNRLKDVIQNHPEIGTLSISFIYIHTENADYRQIEKKMKRLLGKLEEAIAEEAIEGMPVKEKP